MDITFEQGTVILTALRRYNRYCKEQYRDCKKANDIDGMKFWQERINSSEDAYGAVLHRPYQM